MKTGEFLRLWLDTYKRPTCAPRTVSAYRFALAHLSPEITGAEIDQINAMQLQREINDLAATYSRQAQLLYTALNQAFKKALRLGMIAGNPMQMVDKPAHTRAEPEILTAAEAAAYFRAALAGDRRGVLLVLMLCLGLRRNEARGLLPDDLDAEGILHIRHQRTAEGLSPLKSRSSRREIPVPEALRSFFRGGDGDYLVDCSENGLRRAHLAALRAAGIGKRVTLHGLRHSCATIAIEEGAELVTVQQLLGHRHFGLTADIYVHPSRKTLTKCTRILYNSFGPRYGDGARLEIV